MSEQERFYNANDFNSSPLNMNIDPDAESTPLQLEMNLANLDPALRAPVATRHRYYQAVLNILEESRTLNPENYFTFAPQMQELSRLAHEFDVWQCEITRLNLNVEEADAEADTANIQRNFDRAMKLARLPYLKLSEENRRQNETKSQQDQQTLLSSISAAVAAATSSNSSLLQTNAVRSAFKLPPLQLPKFDGTLSDWQNFKARYEAAVHNNANLGVLEKFQFLLAQLSNEPLNRIKGLPLEPSSYAEAWNLLCEHYDSDKRHLASHFSALADLPDLKQRNEIPPFLAKIQEHLHALRALKQDLTVIGPALVMPILKRFSEEIMGRFEDQREDCKKFATLTEIEDFLKSETVKLLDSSTAVAPPTQKATPSAAKILVTSSEATPGSQKAKPKNSSNSKKNKNSSNQTSEQSQSCQCCVSTKPSTDASSSHQNSPRINPASGRAYYCQWCEENHPLVQCDKIKSLTVAQRRAQVKAEGRCWNCLSVKHHSRLCPSTKRCLHHPTEKHNTLLCEHVSAGTSPAPAVAQTVPATAPSVNAAVSSFSRHSGADPTICVAKSPPTVNLLPTALVQLRAASGTHPSWGGAD